MYMSSRKILRIIFSIVSIASLLFVETINFTHIHQSSHKANSEHSCLNNCSSHESIASELQFSIGNESHDCETCKFLYCFNLVAAKYFDLNFLNTSINFFYPRIDSYINLIKFNLSTRSPPMLSTLAFIANT